MSKHNKVNKDHYTQRGRLTPDEAAREQVKQRPPSPPEKRAASARQAQTRDAKQSD
ncbi:MAG TPA: hypothetical protein VFP85_15730 [Vicinamibacterales bacterium]|nr:hypothetical protein [Vicinamibacterales bacterium]